MISLTGVSVIAAISSPAHCSHP